MLMDIGENTGGNLDSIIVSQFCLENIQDPNMMQKNVLQCVYG